jgi:predicted permease
MLGDLLHRVRSLFRRDLVEHELDEEMRFHVEQQLDSYMRDGLSRDEALRRARLEFGGFEQVREEHRDARGVRIFEDLVRDVRYAVRQLRRSPGFTVAALLCLGLGIGATTAIFSVVNAVLLQPLPFPESDRLVRMVENVPAPSYGRVPFQRGLSYTEFLDWRAQSKTLSDAYAVGGGPGQRLVHGTQGWVGLIGTMPSTNAFTMLQMHALRGRTFDERDEQDPNVVILSYDTWKTHFNAHPAILGRAIEFRAGALINGVPPRLMTVVGVLPEGVTIANSSADYYWPLTRSYKSAMVELIGQLAPGVSLESALAEANSMGAALRGPLPANAAPLTVPRFDLVRLKDRLTERLRPALRVFLAAVVVVLIIVCANIANLLLARGTARQREISVRFAIGASRARVVRQILTESLVLACAGGAIGAFLGAAGVTAIKRTATIEAPGIYRLMFGSTLLPRADEVAVDLRMLGISFGLAIITSIVFGLLAALTLSRKSQLPTTKTRDASTGRLEPRIRATLVVGQLVMATILLVCAGLLAHTFVKLSNVNNGYDASNVLAFDLVFPHQYSVTRKAEEIGTLLTRLRSSPNVTSAGFSRHGLLIGEEIFLGTFVPRGRSLEDMRRSRARFRAVSDGYLTAMGVPVLNGRELGPRDDAGAPPVIVMSRSAARQYFGGTQPVGQFVDWHFDKGQAVQMRVVGVVEDLRQESPTDDVFPEVFADYRQVLFLLEKWGQKPGRQDQLVIGFNSFAVRTIGDPALAIPAVRAAINDVDPDIAIDVLIPMTRLAASAVAPQRFYAVMLGLFASVAGVLAAIGIYGVLTYAVIERTQEIGIRMAIGAQRARVLVDVLRHGLLLTGIGITVGLAGAAISTRLLQGLLFGITPLDPQTFVAVSLAFAVVALIASYLPARRATKVDALVALRHE